MTCFFRFLLCILPSGVYAQNIYLEIFAGSSNYQGDLQEQVFLTGQAKVAVGAGLSWQLTSNLSLRGMATFAKVGADDRFNLKNYGRGLNFSSNIYEGQVVAVYDFRGLEEHASTPYAFLGLGIYHFNPTTTGAAGNKVYLMGLSTEGEGFYLDRKPYSLYQLCIPFGGGARFAVSDKVRVGAEFGMRMLFTDYLDDVSTTYVDKDLLLNSRGATAVEVAYRGKGPYPAGGSPRGSAKNKDWYYFFGVTSSLRIVGTKSNILHGRRRVVY